ncbi:Stf0 sulphotransferase [Mycobacteroides abscessus subsp. abscessus]|nr:Stf0 sulphotransferase [Mycobacteroides abscessus subsp. abscessus]
MPDHPTAYLVLASQRSGSTLLVESLRATGVAGEPQEFFQYLPTTSMSPQPREWFADVQDESILRLLDPLDEGKPDLAPATIWRDYIRTVGRTPNGIWGGKLMWNQTPLLLNRAQGLPDRSGEGLLAAIRDVIGSDPVLVHVYRPDVVSQAVSFWRAVQTRVWRGRPDPVRDARAEYHAGAIAHVITMLQAQEAGWRRWFAEENIEPIDISYPYLWRNLTEVVGTVLEALGQDPRLAPPPVLERQADQRSDDWVDRYRADAEKEGLPDRSGDGLLAAIRDVVGSDPVLVHVYRPDVVSQAVSFWRAVQTRVWRGRPDPVRDARAEYHAGAIAHVITMLQAQETGWRRWFAEEDIEPIDISYPYLWRNLTEVVGTVLEALGQDPRLAPPPVLERQADQRSDDWVDRYRADAEKEGLPL